MDTSLAIRTAVQALRANVGRSALTILGIVIGVLAIVLIVALGQGARQLILDEVQSIGADTIIIRPGRQPDGPSDIADTILADSVKDRDVKALLRKENVPGLDSVAPAVLVSGSVSYEDNLYRPFTLGWTAEGLARFFQIAPQDGFFFTEDDIRQRTKVAIIGDRVRQELFGGSDAVGEFITIRGKRFRVVGTLKQLGQVAVFNIDELVVIPYSTAQKDILGIDYYHEVLVKTSAGADVDQVAADIRATLRETHGIDDPSKDDFFVLTQQNIVDQISTVTQILTIFLVAIAAVSLIVGGVGIMNIMLVSVTERTREIGLRKAVGATSRDIMRQFLFEAAILTAAGGVLGTVIAVAISILVILGIRQQYGIGWPIQIPVGAILLGVGMAIAVGIGFGLYPARQAARKSPIEALRYE
jgi:putative ABC transport system permease protein